MRIHSVPLTWVIVAELGTGWLDGAMQPNDAQICVLSPMQRCDVDVIYYWFDHLRKHRRVANKFPAIPSSKLAIING